MSSSKIIMCFLVLPDKNKINKKAILTANTADIRRRVVVWLTKKLVFDIM